MIEETWSETREICIVCGMVANIDPSGHHERYHHLPEVRRHGVVHRFSYFTFSFRPVAGAQQVREQQEEALRNLDIMVDDDPDLLDIRNALARSGGLPEREATR